MSKTVLTGSFSRMLLSAALLVTSATSALADGSPPPGKYNCMKYLHSGTLANLGTLEIKGNKYRGMSDDGDFATFSVDGDGGIKWSQGLTGMPDGFFLTKSKYLGPDPNGHPLIKIHYSNASGADEQIDAVLEN